MGCPQCGHPNSDTAKFCEEGGTRLITTCLQCGSSVNPTARFCAEYGTPRVIAQYWGNPYQEISRRLLKLIAEGFDTKDLQEAKVLLAELGEGR